MVAEKHGPGVIVGVDFSDSSRTAADYAAILADGLKSRLYIAHAWNPTTWQGMNPSLGERFESLLGEARTLARNELDHWIADTKNVPAGMLPLFEDGPASRVLPEIAQRERARLLVVGRHGHASLAHVFLGSVSERVARGSPCPVVLVPNSTEPAGLPIRLLVGFDFSEHSEEALRFTVALARDLGCPDGVVCACVIARHREVRADPAALAARRATVEADLINVVDRLTPMDLPVEIRVDVGHPDQLLMTLAREARCDVIVVGARGLEHADSALLGGTTQRMLKQSRLPVVVVSKPVGAQASEPPA